MTPGRPRSGRGDTLGRIEHEISVMIRRIRRVIGERARAVHPDLQPGAYLTLVYLHERGAVRSSVIVETFGIDKGAISRQITNLVDLGLAERVPDLSDRRAALVQATDEAHRRLDSVEYQRRDRFDHLLAEWDDHDLITLAELLGRYNASLEARDPAEADDDPTSIQAAASEGS